MIRELTELYRAGCAGRAAQLPPLPVGFADFAAWQRQLLDDAQLDRLLTFWQHQLDEAPTTLELPVDRPRSQARLARGGRRRLHLAPRLTASLAELGQRHGATLFMTLLASYQALLARHTGQHDLLTGSPIAGRDRRELEGLIGFFVNTLVLRAQLDATTTFGQLLDQVRDTTLAAYAHQQLPFERLVEAIEPDRSLDHSPLFQAAFLLQNVPREVVELPELTLAPWPAEHDSGGSGSDLFEEARAKFDLTLSVTEASNTSQGAGDGLQAEGLQAKGLQAKGLQADLEFNRDLFDTSTAERLLHHWQRLLEAVVADPDTELATSSMLSPAEHQQLLHEWNDTARPTPDGPVTHPVLSWARRRPDAVAVTIGDRVLTYGGLERHSLHLAQQLRDGGVTPEVPVALVMARSPELAIAALAVLRAGGAFLPIDPTIPDERLAYQLIDSGAPIVLTKRYLLPLPEGVAAQAVCVEPEVLGVEPKANARTDPPMPEPVPPGDGLAYMIYTSGSTGRPKGTQLHHLGFRNLVEWHRKDFAIEPDDRSTWLAGPGFDASVWELWTNLISGASLHVPPIEYIADPERISRWAIARRLTRVFLPTPVAEAALASGALAAGEPGRPLTAARTLFTGGDRLRRRPVGPLPFKLINLYGPTETTMLSTSTRIDPLAEDVPHAAPPIGRPLFNLRTFVLDRQLRLVPIGVAGELYVAGRGLGRGYLNLPRRTACAWLPDPNAESAGARLYATGDRVRQLPNGVIEFLGRLDGQVKIRGFRIELGEIEAALLALDDVSGAAVVHHAEGSRQWLVAYLATESGGQLAAQDVQQELAESLPEYMVPARIVTLEAIPLTTSGKVDRRTLAGRAEDDVAALEGDAYVAPRTPLEARLAELWTELLGVERVGMDDHFFALGGHSLLATQLVSRVRDELGLELPLVELFAQPTVAELAGILSEQEEAAEDAITPLPDRSTPLRLSFAQERLWFLDRFAGGSAAYNIPAAVWLRGRLDVNALRRALSLLVERHETLRTRFVTDPDGALRQVVAPERALPLPVLDLEPLSPADRQRVAREHAIHTARQEFELAHNPLMRVRLLRLDEREHVLVLVIHHIVADGWSMAVLLRDMGDAYRVGITGRAPTDALTPLPVQYVDYAQWQRSQLTGARLEQELAFWRSHLEGVPTVLELPTDRPRPRRQSSRGASVTRQVGSELTRRLETLAETSDATLFMTLLAAFNLLLGRLAGVDQLIVGTPIAGRQRRETEGLIGMFLNNLPLAADLRGTPSFRQLTLRVRRSAVAAYAHQDVPFERLLDELAPQRDPSRSPLFQVFFNMLNLPQWQSELPELTMEPLALPETIAKFDLTLYVAEAEGGLHLDLVYSTDLFDAQRAEILLEQYVAVLRQAAVAPDRSIDSLRLVDPAPATPGDGIPPVGASRLDNAWRGSVPAQFADNARRWGERPAVISDVGSWTYSELAARSHRLAHWLLDGGQPEGGQSEGGQTGGLKRGQPVVIFAHRSPPLVAAVLGTLAAGGAFVIVDPAMPAARLAKIIQRARPGAWLALADAGPEPAEVVEALDALGCRRLSLPAGDDPLAGWPTTLPALDLDPHDAACIAFTSGSTGTPKGIVGRHGPLTHFIPFQVERFGLMDGQRTSMLSGLAHDPLQRDLFTPLMLGGTVVIPDPQRMLEPGYLATWMARQEIAVTHLTPALVQLLGDAEANSSARVAMQALRHAFIVGDVLRRRDVERLRELAPNVMCVNLYGSTETQRAVGYFLPSEDASTAIPETVPEILPLGRGMRGVELVIDARHGGVAGIGELGEVVMRSSHLARGYLDEPARTAERFEPDPMSTRAGERRYRTGDLGRYLPSGDAVFAGRGDRQVKIRGFRVELAEIETVIERHPEVRRAAVVLHEDDALGTVLAAYLVATGDERIAGLADFVADQLPAYMVPAAFVPLASLPLTANRKLDRAALARRPLTVQPTDPGGIYVAPRSAIERELAGIFEHLLGGTPVSVRDSFFDLGGHSLLAVRLAARVERRFAVALPLAQLFRQPTVAGLARWVSTHSAAPGEPSDASASPLVLLSPPGSNAITPLVLVHPLGGTVLCYHELAQRLGDDLPVYALQAPGIDGGSPVDRLETLVERYLEALEPLLVAGRIHLGGWSMGGLVAYELARQLRRQKRPPASLTMIDSRVPSAAPTLQDGNAPAHPLDQLFVGGRRASELFEAEELAELERSDVPLERQLASLIDRGHESGLLTPELDHEHVQRLVAVMQANHRAQQRYRPGPYAGEVLLLSATDQSFRASNPAFDADDPTLGWSALVTGALEVQPLAGDHFSLLQPPQVAALAERLKRRLQPVGSITG
ncbi:MAG: amino acid adenylation domain-containing protein [Acidobacteriota bacterium]